MAQKICKWDTVWPLDECAFFVALSPGLAGRDEASVRQDVLELTRHLQDSGEGSRVEIPGWAARQLRRERLVEGSMALPTPLWMSVLRLAEPRRESDAMVEITAPVADLAAAQVVASRRRRRRRQHLTVPRIGSAGSGHRAAETAERAPLPAAAAAFSRTDFEHPFGGRRQGLTALDPHPASGG